MYKRTTVPRPPRRYLSRGGAALVWALACLSGFGLLASCGGSPHRPVTSPTSQTTGTASSSTTQQTSTSDPAVGQQAFTAYERAFSVIAEIAGDPSARSTDPRLAQALVDPFYSQVVQEINLYRLRDEVVHGSYSFANFRLDTVSSDGRVIFTDCQTNSQAIYNAKTGALVGNAGTSRIPEQVVAYRSGPGTEFKIADENQGPAVTAARNACAP